MLVALSGCGSAPARTQETTASADDEPPWWMTPRISNLRTRRLGHVVADWAAQIRLPAGHEIVETADGGREVFIATKVGRGVAHLVIGPTPSWLVQSYCPFLRPNIENHFRGAWIQFHGFRYENLRVAAAPRLYGETCEADLDVDVTSGPGGRPVPTRGSWFGHTGFEVFCAEMPEDDCAEVALAIQRAAPPSVTTYLGRVSSR